MKYPFLVGIVLLVVACGGVSTGNVVSTKEPVTQQLGNSDPVVSPSKSISVDANGFTPSSVSAPKGTAFTVTNTGTEDALLQGVGISSILPPGETVEVILTQTGTMKEVLSEKQLTLTIA